MFTKNIMSSAHKAIKDAPSGVDLNAIRVRVIAVGVVHLRPIFY